MIMRRVTIGLMVLVALGCSASWWGVRINTSCSAKRGVWLPAREQTVGRGSYVELCPRKDESAFLGVTRGYVTPYGSCPQGHASLIKRVVAVGGDRVEVSSAGLRINGVLKPESKPLRRDSKGLRLPRAPVAKPKVESGDLWVLSENRKGFDSRYFGPIAAASVQQVIVPWITVGDCG